MNYPVMGRFLYSPADTGGAGGSADAAGKATDTDAGKSGEGKTFTEKQLNDIVSKRVNEVKATFSDQLKATGEQLAQLQSQLDQRKIADAEGQKQYEEAKRLREEGYAKELEKERQARMEAESRYRTTAVTQAITAAAAAGKAAKPDQVVALLKDRIKFDDTDTPRFDDGTSVPDGVSKFLSENPHMVQAGGRQGTGAQAQGAQRGQGAISLQGMTPEQIRATDPALVVAAARATQNNPFRREG